MASRGTKRPAKPSRRARSARAAGGAGSSTAVSSDGQRQLAQVAGSDGEIARAVGTSRQAVHQWRRGEKKPGAPSRLKLQALLGIDPAAWDRDGSESAAPTAEIRVGGTSLEQIDAEIASLRLQASAPGLIASARVRISEAITRAVAQRSRVEREQAMLEERIVREHPAYRRMKQRLLEALKPFPDAAKAAAKALLD